MSDPGNNHSNLTRVLCAVLGTFSLLFALLMGIAGIAYAIDNLYNADSIAIVLILFFIALVLGLEGVLMFVLPARIDVLRRQPAAGRGRDWQPNVSAQSEDAGPHVHPTAQPVPSEVPEDTSQMLLRSDDIFATARDIVHTHQTNPSATRNLTHLASMLSALALESWNAAPTCCVTKLARTSTYWLRANTAELGADDYDRLVAAEAAMNLDHALPELARYSTHEQSAVQKTDAYLRAFIDQKPVPYNFDKSLGLAYPQGQPVQEASEWFLRASMVNDAECVRVPFRLIYDLRSNAQAHIAVLSAEIPRPACFAIVDSGEARRVARARAYALRLSWLLASHALANVPTLQRIEVLCHEHASEQCLLCITYTRELVKRLSPLVHGTAIDERGFPQDDAIVVSFGDDGWFMPVRPAIPFDDESVAPHEWFPYPELDNRPLSDRAAEVTGARCVSDLGINENGPRAYAADVLFLHWHALEQRNCKNMVATLVDMRQSTNNVSVAEACERTTAALLDGSIDPTDEEALRAMLVSDGALQDAVRRASRLMDNEGHPDPESALSVLHEALDPILSFGFYADDESYVYRYFGSLPERVAFNTRIDDHRREVRLVPDSYFNALSLLAAAHTALEQYDEAIAAADEIMRIAPASVDAAMRKVRALENQSRILEAAELIKQYAELASTPRDAALAHYRLAYMEWKLGREDLASACYQRALTWDTPLSNQAKEELDDLLKSYSNLRQLEPDQACALLTKEGIPLGFTAADQERTLMASALLVDEHVFRVAQVLLSVLCAANGDDVLVGIRRTLDA